MSDYETLKSRKYFELNYSVIPDNKIQKVVGTYNRIDFDISVTHEDQDYRSKFILEKKSGGIVIGYLPVIPSTSTSYDTHEYYELVDFSEGGTILTHGYRREQVSAKFDVYITDDNPMKFKEDEAGSISVSAVSGNTYKRSGNRLDVGLSSMWLELITNNDTRLECFVNYNMTGDGSYTTESIDTLDIKSATVDSYWNGNRTSADYENRYLMILHIEVYVIDNYQEYQRSQDISGTKVTGYCALKCPTGFKLSITYYNPSTQSDIEFEYHSDPLLYPEYNNYPLKITGNEFTTGSTRTWATGGYIDWHQWISNQLINRYQDGKLFINAKVKASYLIENQLQMNSEMLIADVDNSLIVRGDKACIFQLKNIEYNYDGGQFIANIVLLEDRAEELLVPMEVYSYFVFDFNNVNVQSVSVNTIQLKDAIAAFDDNIKTLSIDSNPLSIEQNILTVTMQGKVDVATLKNTGYLLVAIAWDKVAAFSADISNALFTASYVIDVTQAKASSISTKRARLKSYNGFGSKMDVYSYTKVDTAFAENFGYGQEIIAVAADCQETQLEVISAYDNRCDASVSSTIGVSVLFDLLFAADGQTYISTLEVIQTSVLLDYTQGNKISRASVDTPIQLNYTMKASDKLRAAIRLKTDRPTTNEYFFDLSIEDWIGLSIEDMLEIYLT